MNWTNFSLFKVTYGHEKPFCRVLCCFVYGKKKQNTHPVVFLYFIGTALGNRDWQSQHPIITQPIKNRINIK